MKRTFPTLLTLAAAGVLAFQTLPIHAQDDAPPPPPNEQGGGPGGPGGPGGRGGRGGDWRQRMAEMIKTQMKATDDEWSVIQPLLEKVEIKMRESMGRRFGGMGGGGRRGGPGGPGGGGDNNGGGNNGGGDNNRAQAAGMAETQALRTTLDGDAATADIKTKLQAVRDQRKKSEAELASARADLKKVLNLRQEAVLVLAGVLD